MPHKKSLFTLLGWSLTILLVGCNLPSPSGSGSSGGAGGSTSASGPCANSVYPVTVGNTWNYQMSGTTNDTYTRTIQTVDSSGFTDQDTFSNGVSRTGKWNCAAGDLTALDPVGATTANVQFSGNSTDFQTTALTGVTLPAHIQSGDSWNQTLSLHGTVTMHGASAEASSDIAIACTAAGSESLAVPAGSFNAMKVTCQDTLTITVTTAGVTIPTNLNFEADSWYAPGVGWVKTISSGSGLDTTIELTSYTVH
ncbi:MAG TPA: hypothetical protein VMC09_03710 [Anaerolineales bacterium]|nr:hypothetical protein [Anaerolineales bacterium]